VSNEKCYVGIAKCGCVKVAMSPDLPTNVITKETAKIIRDGLSLERMATEDVRAAKWGCEVCRPAKKGK
jgi:hypothetical protein